MNRIIFTFTFLSIIIGAYIFAQAATTPIETSYTALVGQKVVLNASAEGTTPMTFNWYKDGNFIGVTDTITLNSVQTSNAGAYKVVAVNSVGQSESDIARLVVVTPIAPNKVKITVTISNS